MKQKQYVIINRKGHYLATEDFNTILFDTQEEAEELICNHPDIFDKPRHLEIKSGIFFIDDSVNYKDIKNIYWKEN